MVCIYAGGRGVSRWAAMLNLCHPVLSPAQLRRLREHKYRCHGSSIAEDHLLRFFHDWLITRVPLWVAPNLITFLGFCLSMGSSLTVLLQDPSLEGKV